MKDRNKELEIKLERIGHEEGNEEAWICTCGNRPAYSGFYTGDREGNEVEPVIGSDWEDLYVCAECGRIVNMDTLEVVGQNLNPRFLN